MERLDSPTTAYRLGEHYFERAISMQTTSHWDLSEPNPVSRWSTTESDFDLMSETVVSKPPDGGLKAWLQVLVSFLLFVNGFGYISSFGIFQAHYEQGYQESESRIALIGSIQLFLLSLLGTLSGRLIDSGYFMTTVGVGCGLHLLGIFAASWATKYYQILIAQGVLQGIGSGLTFTPLVWLVSTYFSRKRGIALGLASLGSPIGGIVFTSLARQMIPTYGFRWALRSMGFIMTFNTIIVLICARPRIASRKGPLLELRAFREAPYFLFAVGMFCTQLGLWFAYYFIPKYGSTRLDLTSSTNLTVLLVLSAAGIPGRLLPPYLSDLRFSPLPSLIVSILVSGILLFIWIAVSNLGGLIVFVILYGFWANALQTLFTNALASLTTDITKLGVRVGMVFTVVSFACLAGAPIGGRIVKIGEETFPDEPSKQFLFAQVYAGSSMALGGTLVLLAGILKKRRERRAAEKTCSACGSQSTMKCLTCGEVGPGATPML